MRLDDPVAVRARYITEAGLETRRSLYVDAEGDDPRDVAFEAVAEIGPRVVLEVAYRPGGVCEPDPAGARLRRHRYRHVGPDGRPCASARCRRTSRGRSGSQFEAGTFDCVVAAWMLYHVSDLDRGVAELARVLRPGGRLVAVTNSERHLQEARDLAGVDMSGRLSFSRENGELTLRRHLPVVRRLDVDGWVTFSDADSVRDYVASMITESVTASLVADFAEPLRAGRRVSVFVAEMGDA